MAKYYLLVLGAEPPGAPPNEAKRELARRLVDRFHGEGAGAAAEEHFNRLFVDRGVPDDVPEVAIEAGEVHLPGLLGSAFGLSSSEGRRLLDQGGVKLDGEALPARPLDVPAASLDGRTLQVGERRFAKLRIAG